MLWPSDKAGGKCLNIVNRVNGAFCHYHPPPDINRKLDVVRSVAYKEESEKQALKSNKEGLENMNTTNSTTMNIAAPFFRRKSCPEYSKDQQCGRPVCSFQPRDQSLDADWRFHRGEKTLRNACVMARHFEKSIE